MLARGEITEVNFPGAGKHTALVLSCPEVYHSEKMYLVTMITHSPRRDKFTFEIRKEMYVDGDFYSENQQVRLHFILMVADEDLGMSKGAKLKRPYVDQIVQRIASAALSES
ncbi:MAG: type II toxin-antitoxin system PemK/MazF family toxin [Flavobacteriales bacterium]|jgi:hypothetical protein